MKKIITLILFALVLSLATPRPMVEAGTKIEKQIKNVAKEYAKGRKQDCRYESAYELLEEYELEVTKKNVKLMKKWVKHYEES